MAAVSFGQIQCSGFEFQIKRIRLIVRYGRRFLGVENRKAQDEADSKQEILFHNQKS